MPHLWQPRCAPPDRLVVPCAVDPTGQDGPTKGQARGPLWRRSSPGLYVPNGSPECVEQRILEAAQRLPPGGSVTGWAALRMAGGGYFDGLKADGVTPRAVRLVVPRGCNLRPWNLTEAERSTIVADEIRILHGAPCTTAERAVFDEARKAVTFREAVVVVDMALAAGLISLESFRSYAVARRGWPGSRRVRAAAALADARSLSPRDVVAVDLDP